MEWVIGLTPFAVAAAGATVFFLAGREPKERRILAPPPSSGEPTSGSANPPAETWASLFPLGMEPPTLTIEWRSPNPKPNPSAAPLSSLPIRTVAYPPVAAPTTPFSEVEPASPSTELSVPPTEDLSDLSPIWSSHWASSSPARWLSGSDTQQLQRVSFEEPPAIAGGPASSVWWAPGHASLFRSSATAYSNGRSSHRAPNTDYLPPWARSGD